MKDIDKIMTHICNGKNVWIDLPGEERVIKAKQDITLKELRAKIESLFENERILKIEYM